MNDSTPPPAVPAPLLALIACAVAFIGWSGRELPGVVASHFDAAGDVNGRMPKGAYLAIMLLTTTLVPLLTVVVPNLALRSVAARIKIPNRSYWLAPQRRAETIRFLSRQMAIVASLVILFLCYVQWLVVEANAHTPPAMNQRAFLVGLAVFLGCICSWTLRVLGRFARRP